MSGMHEELASYFGTNAAVSEEEIEKEAQAQMFLKLAEEEGINIDELSDEQVQELYDATFEDGGSTSVEDTTLQDQAQAEFAEKQAAAEKFADAEFMGRTMAHAYVNELQKIAAEQKEAAKAGPGVSLSGKAGVKEEKAQLAKVQEMNRAKQRAAQPSGAGTGASGAKSVGKIEGKGREFMAALKTRKGKRTAAGVAGGLGLAAVGAYGTKKALEKKAEVEALDIQAAQLAFQKIAASEEFGMEEAEARLNAVLTLGPTETEKCAGVTDQEAYLDIRSLELAELAGYPVTWPEQGE